MNTRLPDILIVGRGVGGLMLAYTLRHYNVRCRIRIIEAGGRPTRNRFGYTLAPNGLQALSHVGLLPVVVSRGTPIRSVEVIPLGSLYPARFHYGGLRFSLPHALGILPNELQLLLEDAVVHDIDVHYHQQFVKLVAAANGRKCLITKGDNGLCSYVGDVIIGSDGIHSRIRGYVAGAKKPHRTNEGYHVILGGLVEGLDSVRQYVGTGKMLGVVPVGKQNTFIFWMVRPAEFSQLRGSSIEKFKSLLTACEPRLESALECVSSWDDVFDSEVLLFHSKKWFLDNIVLLGDSLHAFTPSLAQGVNTTLVDAVTLGTALADWVEQGSDPVGLREYLQRYRRTRYLHALLQYNLSRLATFSTVTRVPFMSWGKINVLRLLAKSPIAATFLRLVSGLIPANHFQKLRLSSEEQGTKL